MNISDVSYFKIHPAIGVARIANNDDYFEFFQANSQNFLPAEDYMSEGGSGDPEPGKLRLKRQAVQFTVYAYDENNDPIGTVDELFPDAQLKWTANVGNRKLFNYSEKKGGGIINPVSAEATAETPDAVEDLNGLNPWNDSEQIYLGSITGTGVFIPGKGGVTRENGEDSPIDHYPANQSGELQTTDTTCDGTISVEIINDGEEVSQSIIPAWVISAPGQHALSLTPVMAADMANNFGSFDPSNANNNKDWLKSTKNLLGIDGDIYDPTGLDVLMMSTMNADYNPGMEVNLSDSSGRLENGTSAKDFFYPRNQNHIQENEIRVEPKDDSNGALPGQLSSGLCSTWQGDMMLCLNWWTAENPSQAYGPDGNTEIVIYKEDNPNEQMNEPEEINKYMDFRGIVDDQNVGANIKLDLVYDPNRPDENA